MKPHLMNIFRKCQFPLILACEFLPIPLLLLSYLTDTLFPFSYAYAALYTVLSILGILLPGKLRPYFGILGIGLILGLSALALRQETTVFLLFPTALYLFLFLISLQIGSWAPEEELHSYWIWTGVLIHLIAQFLLAGARNTGTTRVLIASTPCLISFFIYIFFAMLSLNRSSLTLSSMGRQKASRSMKGKNVVFTLVVFGAALLVSLVPALVRAMERAMGWIVAKAGAFINWLITATFVDLQSSSGSSGSGLDQPSAPLATPETSRFALFLQEVALGLIKLAFIALTAAVLFFLLRALLRILKRILGQIIRYTSSISEDYEDEITDTRTESGGEVSFLQRLRTQLEPPEDPALPPAQRIRRRYLRILRRHPEWSSGSTAREKLDAPAAALYERARYSGHPVTQEEADRFQAETRRV